jgi:hypothetical protein
MGGRKLRGRLGFNRGLASGPNVALSLAEDSEKKVTPDGTKQDMKNILKSLWLGLCLSALLAQPVSAQKLTGVTPATLSTGVAPDTTVTFTFDADMDPIQDFTWLANSGAFPSQLTGFTYEWTTVRKLVATKTGGFPANTMIIWAANEEGFSDQFGFPLDSSGMNSGFFTTGSGSGGGGGGGDGTGAANVSLIKFANHDQFGSADPVLTTNFIYYFGAIASAPASRGLTDVTLTIPGGAVSNLFSTPFAPTNFFLTTVTNSLTTLNAQFPAGQYAFGLVATTSNETVVVTLPADPFPVPAKFSNFTAGQAVDPAVGFTLQFNAGGVATELAYVKVLDPDASKYVYESPDDIDPGHLIGTSTSVELAAGTLQEGKTYEVELGRWIVSTNLVGGNRTAVSIGSVTRTVLKTIGGAVSQIELRNPTFSGGFFSAEATLTANQSYSLERSTNATTWESISSVFAVAPTQMFFDFTPPPTDAIYRVKKD